jgi:hypothetical protein
MTDGDKRFVWELFLFAVLVVLMTVSVLRGFWVSFVIALGGSYAVLDAVWHNRQNAKHE